MPIKPRFFLLDAVIVIDLHRFGLWKGLIANAEVIVSGIVIGREPLFYDARSGERHSIDLVADLDAGRITRTDADAEQLSAVAARFDPVLRESIDIGELEALALLFTWEGDRPRFCTVDRKAIEGLCSLDLAEYSVSAEERLRAAGVRTKGIDQKRSRATFNRWLEDGKRARIQRRVD